MLGNRTPYASYDPLEPPAEQTSAQKSSYEKLEKMASDEVKLFVQQNRENRTEQVVAKDEELKDVTNTAYQNAIANANNALQALVTCIEEHPAG